MELFFSKLEVGHLLIGDDDCLWVVVVIQFATDGKSCCGGCGGYQVDDHAIADERRLETELRSELIRHRQRAKAAGQQLPS